MAFDIKEPYKLLCEPSFIYQSLEKKLHIKEQLPKLLGGRVTPMVTECGMAELRRLHKEVGDQFIGSIVIAKGLYRIKCGHDQPLGAAACCGEMLEDRDNKWLIASQDENLRAQIRQIPGVPILYLNGQVPVLEPPSETSTNEHQWREQVKSKIHDWEQPKLIEKERLETLAALKREAVEAKRAKRKKMHNPHPLSNLKKKSQRTMKKKKRRKDKNGTENKGDAQEQ